ncbi:hypothetical protein ABVT39_014532 [Epinephelus coioides]
MVTRQWRRDPEKNQQSPPAETIPEPSATIIDGMSLVQKMKGGINQVCRERENRGCTTGIQVQNTALGHRIQQWRRFLRSSANKTNPISFLVVELKTPKLRHKLNDKQVYIASEESCLHITKDHWAEVECLQSNQEEADTRIILHAAHAAKEGYSAVVVAADDTDVLVLCLAFSADISCPLFQKNMEQRTGLGILISPSYVRGWEIVSVTGMHAFTGCDTVSAFAGCGKLRALKLITRSEHFQEVFLELGQLW